MHGTHRLRIPAMIVLITLSACMEAGDRGRGPACQSGLEAAERALKAAQANSIGKAFDWAKAATLIAAARTQQQFNEFENCVIKARNAREILSIRR